MTIPVLSVKPARVLPLTATTALVLSVMENSMGVFSESSLAAEVMLSGEQAARIRVVASAMGRMFFFIILSIFILLIINCLIKLSTVLLFEVRIDLSTHVLPVSNRGGEGNLVIEEVTHHDVVGVEVVGFPSEGVHRIAICVYYLQELVFYR